MVPHAEGYRNNRDESGIRRVVEAYFKYLPRYGVDLIPKDKDDFELLAVHAGAADASQVTVPQIAHCHGLYWSADYPAQKFEWAANAKVIDSLRRARTITVPSEWVAETIRRELRVNPFVVPHGIDWQDWQSSEPNEGYVLWNKNRDYDVCDPKAVGILAKLFPQVRFLTTFAPEGSPPNVKAIGIVPHRAMKKMVQRSNVYLSTTKETFGIGVLEALSSGVPVLGFAHGGNLDLVQHGVSGYLARPNDYDDLRQGLEFVVKYRSILSANARELSKQWTWEAVAEKVAGIYERAVQHQDRTVAVVIPVYNYGDEERLGRALRSVAAQTRRVDRIVVVDDGSTSGNAKAICDKYNTDGRITFIRQDNAGVAIARNHGIDATDAFYLCCLDADDWLEPQFIEACVRVLEADPSLGIAYTGLTAHTANGASTLSKWPGSFDYDAQLERHNSIPTCCVFLREMYERLGGYRQRYAPHGAGAEDGEFWLRAGAYGWGAKKVTDAGLFNYSLGTGQVSGDREYREIDYTAWHPWTKDAQHPFASIARTKFYSHPVRQYDMPEVSVVIPVGPGHEDHVWNALDSLEAQTFRNWEAVVVWDSTSPDMSKIDRLKRVYPYVKLVMVGGKGAGYARNRGAEIARAPLLLFLDADDTLVPECLKTLLMAYSENEAIIYSDHVAKSFMDLESAKKVKSRLLAYDEKTNEAIFEGRAADYDYDRAVIQPVPEAPYLWCNVTSLTPKAWHEAIGGFDEKMPSWEDWDYWIRLARAGYCFVRVVAPLFVYRFYTGNRRERGLRDYPDLFGYMIDKYKGGALMPCNCGNKKKFNVAPAGGTSQVAAVDTASRAASAAAFGVPSDTDVVLVLYSPNRRGDHRVTGPATKRDYGYRNEGDRFYVLQQDQKLMPDVFRIVVEDKTREQAPVEPPPAPELVAGAAIEERALFPKDDERAPEILSEIEQDLPFDLQTIPGISAQVAMQLQAMGAHTLEDVVKLGKDTLMQVKGLGPSRAAAILKYADDLMKAGQQAN